MSDARVRIGMLGAGFIGQMHSLAMRSARYTRLQPAIEADLVVLAEADAGLAREVAHRYQWRHTTTDWGVLPTHELDLFINAGPNHLHRAACEAAAQAGIGLFCEKPLAPTADEAYDIWRITVRHGVLHRCAYMHRFIPAIQFMRRLVREGELGEITNFRSSFLLDMSTDGATSWRFDRAKAGAGAIGDLGSHHIDVARFVVGEVVRVSAMVASRHEGANDDAAVVTAQLDNGALAVFDVNRVSPAHDLSGRIEIDGTRGSVAWHMQRLNEVVIRKPRQGARTEFVTRPEHPLEGFWLPGGIQGSHPLGWNECFAHQSRDILGLAAGQLTESPAATFEDGYRVAQVVDTVLEAANTGRSIAVDYRPSPAAATVSGSAADR
ncbi:Gfo/Idh/MocA family oxidoreductase [Dactylosporangium roseum]|uniref:Gfo/Idh/MocA family oxidoreductase n=1 Tax=Dactylosporangium roseum TaxID=47989 RepID=A0ABY5Z248_9ACTN|nr:Gfo/Idh/MocA family oxidoreductase [Dactylosporangium roseum]UWZ34833.1 Gfo/Idh/MocA family oxidoreductase [Dactylosporangium roseum]